MILDAKIILLTLPLLISCATAQPVVITVYDPPRCPHSIWTEEALTQLENIMYIDNLHDTHRLETINDYDNNKNISTEFGLVLENIAEYNRHCNAIDAYLDTNRK